MVLGHLIHMLMCLAIGHPVPLCVMDNPMNTSVRPFTSLHQSSHFLMTNIFASASWNYRLRLRSLTISIGCF